MLQRQLDGDKVHVTPADRALLAALQYRLPRPMLRRLRLPVRQDTVLRWHRDLLARRHVAYPGRSVQVDRGPFTPSVLWFCG